MASSGVSSAMSSLETSETAPLTRPRHNHHKPFLDSDNVEAPNSAGVYCCAADMAALTSTSTATTQLSSLFGHDIILTTKSGTELVKLPPGASVVIDEIYDSAVHDMGDDEESTESDQSRYVVPPDGGWGWVVVAASFMICFIVDSVAYSYPMIYANMTSVAIQGPVAFFIGATLMALYMITAPFASALVNVYGTRRVIVIGSILTATGLIVSSRTPQNDVLWLVLTFGIMGGVGLGMMYIGAMVSVGTYFDKRRPLALALAVCGSGLGMSIFPLVAHYLLDFFGLGTTLELYACFVLQGAWLGMLVWPLPPRPLHACAKPRRKDLLDRVTEWVGKMRHREDSDDSLADPDTIAERATLVKEAAKERIIKLQQMESLGLATPPTTPGSSASVATGASVSNPHCDQTILQCAALKADAIRCRRRTSVTACCSAHAQPISKSCPQFSSLLLSPVAASNEMVANGTAPGHTLCPADVTQPEQSVRKAKRRCTTLATADVELLEEALAHAVATTPYSSRSTSGVVCELTEVGERPKPSKTCPRSKRRDNAPIPPGKRVYNKRKSALKPTRQQSSSPKRRPKSDDDSDDDDDDMYLHNRASRRTFGTGPNGGTVTSSESDFAIMQAQKPVPLLSVGCFTSILKALEQSLDISLLKDSRFWILALGNIAAMMGLYQIIFVLPALAAYSDNVDSHHITWVIMAVFGGFHTIGRVLTGVMSGPRFRPLLLCNVAFALSAGVFLVFAVAPDLLEYKILCFLAAMHGLCYAIFAVLSTVIIVNVFGVRKLSSCFGMITLTRGISPFLTTITYQLAYKYGTNAPAAYESIATSAGNSTSTDYSEEPLLSEEEFQQYYGDEAKYVQRAYGIAGVIYVGLALAFHLLLHFRYFKRRLLNVQRGSRPRLRCVSVPTPSSLSGYRLPNSRSFGDEMEVIAEIPANSAGEQLNTTTLQIESDFAAPVSDVFNKESDGENYPVSKDIGEKGNAHVDVKY